MHMSAIRMLAFALFIVVRAATQDASKAVPVPQQGRGNRPSPPAQAQCKFADGKTITVDYSSPRMKGRKIFGNLVPYGEVWRTGANEATTFVTNDHLVTVKGTSVPAGNYTIFTVPNADKWTLIINKHTGEGGTPYKYESEELARVPMSITTLSSPVENFTISFDHTGGSCMMHMNWENTQASLEFTEKNTDLPVTH
jgi:hypothetical protein